MDFQKHLGDFPSFPLTTCNLRRIETADAAALYGYYHNEKVYRYLDWHGPSSVDDAIEVINHWTGGYKDGWIIRFGIADKATNELIGTVFLNGFDGKRAEIGYELSEAHWGKGIMSEAVNRVIDFGFTALGRTRIQATVCNENVASERLLLKCGFRFEGTLRQYEEHYVTKEVKDMKLYSIISGPGDRGDKTA